MSTQGRCGVLLMTYGSPVSLERDAVRDYLARVRSGREPAAELVDEFTRRYRVIGGSPLIGATRAQAGALSNALGWPVEVGMRFSEPSIGAGLRSLRAGGVSDVAAIVLSPQYSPLLMGGYGRAVDEACAALGPPAPVVKVAGAWHDEAAFVKAVADRIVAALGPASPERTATHTLMTAHSLPRRVADREPGYLAQLRATAEAVAATAGLNEYEWTFCWQSAGHEPGEWMTPDFADLMPEIAASGARSVLVVPVQFLTDHLETLYDVDIGARQQAERAGLRFARVPSLGTDAGLMAALASVARETLATRSAALSTGPSRCIRQ